MTCKIELTDPDAYGPDKPIRGRAVLQFVATEEFKVIKCIFKGIEKTEWVDIHNDHYNRHYGENTLFYTEAIFAENGQFPPGQHTYPFVFNLPRNMASTYESSEGSIKYNLTLLVDKGIISNYTCEMAVQIESPINFNSIKDQLQLQPTIYEDEKVLCCCCCKSSPVSLKLFFEKEAFVVGEVAKIRVNIVNMSDMSIPQVLIYLQQQNPRMSCNVVLDTTGTIKPGDTIYGRVICNVTTNQCVREIRCKLIGKEHTVIKSAKDTFEANNEFLVVKMTLLGEVTLEPRQHEYPFCFTLPNDIPSTLETEFGWIKYSIKATVIIPFSFDYIDEIELPVKVLIDFNSIQDELQLKPVVSNNEKTVCCLCCAGGEICMNLQLEKNAFILGEIAKVRIEVNNMSRINIEQIMLTLTRIWEYKSEGRKERIKEVLATEKDSGVDAHGQRIYLIQFQIPRGITIHNLVKCILIKESFRLRAEVLLPLAHRDLVVDAHIKLGHIPLECSMEKDISEVPPKCEEV